MKHTTKLKRTERRCPLLRGRVGTSVLPILLAALAFLAGIGHAALPNVLMIVADDQGWGDLSLHGNSRVRTPNLDRLFEGSRQFRNFMTWCVCSPTRAGVLTGRHPFRLGAGPNVGGELELEETTIAEFFKTQGYRTGAFGKWHNGLEPDVPAFRKAFKEAHKHLPNKPYEPGHGVNAHGFDRAVVYYGGGPDKWTRTAYNGRLVSWFHDRRYLPEEKGYVTDLITRYASDFMIREAARGQPFFAYVAFDQVHHPLQAKPEHLARVPAHVTDRKHRLHSAMLLALDDAVGGLLAELDRLGVADNTIVWYFSDNGGLPEGLSLPFKGGKHRVLEGGIHVPAAIRWPARGITNGAVRGMTGYLDVMPTLAGLLGKPLQTSRPLDGRDCAGMILRDETFPERDFFWGWRDHEVVRNDRWKLYRHWDRFELFDMKHDPYEDSDVASANPAVVDRLARRLSHWRREFGVASPLIPVKQVASPAPDGEVLEIRIDQLAPVEPREALRVHFANRMHRVGLGDVVEFDIMYPRGSYRRSGSFISPYRDGDPPVFNARRGVDQFGRLQMPGPMPVGGVDRWEHRAIAIGHEAPLLRSLHAAYFHGDRPGVHRFFIDNLKIVRGDGSVTWVWRHAEDIRRRPVKTPPDRFRNLVIRALPLKDLEP